MFLYRNFDLDFFSNSSIFNNGGDIDLCVFYGGGLDNIPKEPKELDVSPRGT